MNASLGPQLGETAREARRRLGQGLVEVLVARDPPPRLRSRPAQGANVIATAIGALLLFVALLELTRRLGRAAPYGVPRAFEDAELISLLLLSVRFPLWAWRIGFLCAVFVPLLGGESQISPEIALALLVPYWAAGLRHGRATGWAMAALLLLPVWFWVGPGIGSRLLATIVLLVLAVALDATIVSRRAGQELAAQVAQGEAEEARRAVLEERTRIAREMHDVVAHHMSMIAVQAETARYRISGLSEAATDEFAALSSAAREALTDLRRLLGVLRSDAPAEREPQPQLCDVVALVDATRRAGVTVELSMPDNGGASVAAAVGLCAYRVVQEALSNASRHAPGASVGVAVVRDPRALRVNIVNGPPVTPAAAVSAGGRPGHGIAGMSERVTLLGGSLTAIPHGEGGFAVSATLPLVGGGVGQ